MTSNKRGPILKYLDDMEDEFAHGSLSLQRLSSIFGNDGHFVLILFLSLPFLQPIPLFGLSTLFGILIALMSILFYLKKPPWIPKRWANIKLSSKTIIRIAEGSEKIFKKLSFLLHPRWKYFFKEPFSSINMAVLFLNACLLALPLPIPFTNTIPAWAILFQALGHLERDGLFILISYVQAVICLVYFGALALGVSTGLNFMGL